MKKENSLMIGVIGGIILIGGVIWSITEAIKGPPYGFSLILAAAGVVIGMLGIFFYMENKPWIML